MNKHIHIQDDKHAGQPRKLASEKLKLEHNFYPESHGLNDGDDGGRVREKYNRSERKDLMRMVKKIYIH